jgi:hypothetical protein
MKKLLLLALLNSCVSSKKLAEICADKYPPIVSTDTTYLHDTTRVQINSVDTFIVTTKEVITKQVESTARLEVQRKQSEKKLKELYDYDMAIILDLNKMMDKMAKDTSNQAKELRKLKQELTQSKAEVREYKKKLWNVKKYLYGIPLILLALFVFQKWFNFSRFF